MGTQGEGNYLPAKASGGTSPTDILILDFQTPGPGGKPFLLYKPLVSGTWPWHLSRLSCRQHLPHCSPLGT